MESKPNFEAQKDKNEVEGEGFSDDQVAGKLGDHPAPQKAEGKEGDEEELDDELLDEVMGDMEEKLNLTAGERSVGGRLP